MRSTWAKKRLKKGWIFPDYTLKPKQRHVCTLWQWPAKEYWLIAGVWNKLPSLELICLSEHGRTVAWSTLYSTQPCMLSLAQAMSHHMLGMAVLDRTRLGQWLMKRQGAEVLANLVESASTVPSSALSAVQALPSQLRGPVTMPEHYTASAAAEIEEVALRT